MTLVVAIRNRLLQIVLLPPPLLLLPPPLPQLLLSSGFVLHRCKSLDVWEGSLTDLQQRKEASHWMDGEGSLTDLQQRKEASHWMDGKEP